MRRITENRRGRSSRETEIRKNALYIIFTFVYNNFTLYIYQKKTKSAFVYLFDINGRKLEECWPMDPNRNQFNSHTVWGIIESNPHSGNK